MIKYGKNSRKIMISAIIIYVNLIIMGVILINLRDFIQNDSAEEEANYECEITEDSEMTWKYTRYDPILIQNLSDKFNIDLISINVLGVKEGSIIEYEIESIEDTKDKWRLEMSYKSDGFSGENTQDLKIYKDPNEVPNSWIYNIEDLCLRILPSETKDYLDEIKENFKSTESVDIERNSDLSLGIFHYKNNTVVFTEFKYKDNGLIEKFTLIFFDSIALEYVLEDYSLNAEIDESFDTLRFFLIIAITGIFLIMIPLYGYVVSTNNRGKNNKNCQKSSDLKNLSDSKNTYLISNKSNIRDNENKGKEFNDAFQLKCDGREEIKINHNTLKKRKYSFCELCGTKIDDNAIYCTYCGNKL